jgi:hypothetical protein
MGVIGARHDTSGASAILIFLSGFGHVPHAFGVKRQK